MKDHPRLLETAYAISKRAIVTLYPLMKRIGPRASTRLMVRGEEAVKGWIFNCRMCGQCVLHETGMTCPMNCPKHLRNGPCGGVRADGGCEVLPDLPCVWVQAVERSRQMRPEGVEAMRAIQPPLDHALEHTSAWINLIEQRDARTPIGWASAVPAAARSAE